MTLLVPFRKPLTPSPFRVPFHVPFHTPTTEQSTVYVKDINTIQFSVSNCLYSLEPPTAPPTLSTHDHRKAYLSVDLAICVNLGSTIYTLISLGNHFEVSGQDRRAVFRTIDNRNGFRAN